MHIVDGALSLPVLATGGAIALGGVGLGLKKMDPDHIPQVGLLSAAFFLASLIHVPIGPTSVHLILNGLVGLVLGWAAFPALLAGLLLQAVFFGFGGLVVLGANVTNIALPAVLVFFLVRGAMARAKDRRAAFTLGFLAGSLAIALTTTFVALSLAFSGEGFLAAAKLVFIAHLPVMALEGFLTGAAAALIIQVKPELFQLPDHLHDGAEPAPVPVKETLVAAFLALGLLAAGPAEAHNVVADIYLEGNVAEGEVGFGNGQPAPDAEVIVKDLAGTILGRTRTDAEGIFTFAVEKKIDHLFEINLGAGHVVTLELAAAELGGQSQSPAAAVLEAAPTAAPGAAELQVMIEQAVAQQVKPLRKQLLQYENKVRLHDILGGLGYILGLTGLGMWFAARKKEKAP